MQNYIEDNTCLEITDGMEKDYLESVDIQKHLHLPEPQLSQASVQHCLAV